MVDETVFAAALGAVLLGWLMLLAGVLLPPESRRRQTLIDTGGLWLPAALTAVHALLLGLSLLGGSGSEGGLFSLAGIEGKFADRDRLFLLYLEGMVFALFIGRWIALDAVARATPRAFVVPILMAQSALGPPGLLLWLALRSFLASRVPEARS